jgi:hypothetical protein
MPTLWCAPARVFVKDSRVLHYYIQLCLLSFELGASLLTTCVMMLPAGCTPSQLR